MSNRLRIAALLLLLAVCLATSIDAAAVAVGARDDRLGPQSSTSDLASLVDLESEAPLLSDLTSKMIVDDSRSSEKLYSLHDAVDDDDIIVDSSIDDNTRNNDLPETIMPSFIDKNATSEGATILDPITSATTTDRINVTAVIDMLRLYYNPRIAKALALRYTFAKLAVRAANALSTGIRPTMRQSFWSGLSAARFVYLRQALTKATRNATAAATTEENTTDKQSSLTARLHKIKSAIFKFVSENTVAVDSSLLALLGTHIYLKTVRQGFSVAAGAADSASRVELIDSFAQTDPWFPDVYHDALDYIDGGLA